MTGIIYRGETKVLSASARSNAPGQFVELQDGMVHYELAGPSEIEPVVLVPGLSVPYTIWDPTFTFLREQGCRVLRYDLYGRGLSDKPDVNYDQELFINQLDSLLDELGITGKISLVGLSLGGAISVVFAARYPEKVRKLCLIDPAGLPWKQKSMARIAVQPVLGEWIMGLWGCKVLLANFRDYFHSKNIDEELLLEFRDQMQFIGFKKAILSTLRSGIVTGCIESYRQVGRMNNPKMLIWGKGDRVVPFKLSEKAIELLPDVEFHALERAAHMPHFERPEQVNSLLIRFLKA